MQIECFGIVRDRQNFIGPGAGFTNISQQIPYMIIPKRVPPPATSFTSVLVFRFLTSRTKLLPHTRLGTCSFAVSEYLLFWVVSKS